MRYSVFNKSLGNYSVYEGPAVISRSILGIGKSLGASPEDTTDILPVDSTYIGESEQAEGKIVEREYTLKGFAIDFALFFVAGIFTKYIYDRFFALK